jgi:hypothetical protein
MYEDMTRPLWTKINNHYLQNAIEEESELDDAQFNIPADSDEEEH